jgi:protoporphyrinogen oxidase
LFGLGVVDSTRVLASFAARRLFPKHPEASFEDWVANRFGQRLYEIFFKTYTEKVWGVPCTALSADWAAQRIRNLSLGRALLDALKIRRKGTVASLIEEFRYPRFGPGQMYNALAQEAERLGATVCLRHEAAQIRHAGSRITHIILTSDLRSHEVAAGNLISSMPITDLVLRLKPEPPAEVLLAARCLRYRSIITVNLIVDVPAVLPDTWVYLHSPEVRAGRMQLYKNWSPAMVPDSSKSIIGFEYFCREGDELWNAPETALHEIAKSDLCTLRLVDPAMILESFVARYPKAYPVYDDGYRTHLDIIRRYLGCFKNLVCVGRYGQFRYNNMDHSIITGLLGVRRLLGEPVDPWAVNEDAEYHEELGRRASTAGA